MILQMLWESWGPVQLEFSHEPVLFPQNGEFALECIKEIDPSSDCLHHLNEMNCNIIAQ